MDEQAVSLQSFSVNRNYSLMFPMLEAPPKHVVCFMFPQSACLTPPAVALCNVMVQHPSDGVGSATINPPALLQSVGLLGVEGGGAHPLINVTGILLDNYSTGDQLLLFVVEQPGGKAVAVVLYAHNQWEVAATAQKPRPSRSEMIHKFSRLVNCSMSEVIMRYSSGSPSAPSTADNNDASLWICNMDLDCAGAEDEMVGAFMECQSGAINIEYVEGSKGLGLGGNGDNPLRHMMAQVFGVIPADENALFSDAFYNPLQKEMPAHALPGGWWVSVITNHRGHPLCAVSPEPLPLSVATTTTATTATTTTNGPKPAGKGRGRGRPPSAKTAAAAATSRGGKGQVPDGGEDGSTKKKPKRTTATTAKRNPETGKGTSSNSSLPIMYGVRDPTPSERYFTPASVKLVWNTMRSGATIPDGFQAELYVQRKAHITSFEEKLPNWEKHVEVGDTLRKRWKDATTFYEPLQKFLNTPIDMWCHSCGPPYLPFPSNESEILHRAMVYTCNCYCPPVCPYCAFVRFMFAERCPRGHLCVAPVWATNYLTDIADGATTTTNGKPAVPPDPPGPSILPSSTTTTTTTSLPLPPGEEAAGMHKPLDGWSGSLGFAD